ncbi:Fc.00g036940.m01.CDS01 [Cosmosporella sp. VM-42]
MASRQPVRRFAQIVKLKPQYLNEYKAVHAKVWPDVLKRIKECNIEDYSIFHDSRTQILFASFKYTGHDYAADMERMAANPRVREWWAMTDAWQESMVPGAVSSEAGEPGWWRHVEEVFYQP